MTTITEPGVYQLTDVDYHADPVPGGSLSSTGARRLMPPSCPAKYRWEADHPPETTPEFDVGHAAHRLVLGVGVDIVRIPFDEWRSNAAKAAVADAREAGAVPLKPAVHDQVHDMAEVLRSHPVAGRLFRQGAGLAEQSLFWRDRHTGIMRRCRLDWLPDRRPGRMIVADYKTAKSAEPGAAAKAIWEHGYHQQADWNLDGIYELGLAQTAAFVFVFQEKTPPYLITVVEPNQTALLWGDVLNRKAIDTYRHCTETGRWPGYTDDVVLAELPVWAERSYERARDQGAYDVKEVSHA